MMQEQELQPQNNQLIERLLDEQQQSKPSALDAFAVDNQVLITTSRVVNIRYRLYFLVTLVVLVIFVVNLLLPAWDTYQESRAELSTITQQLSTFATKKLQSDADKQLIATIESQTPTIISCLNTRTQCNDIDTSLKTNFSFARSYIQLNNLTDPKMTVNEKILLTNINEYLLKDIKTSQNNGIINQIAIGEPTVFYGNLYYVPLRLNITFATKDALLSFVENIEEKVFSDARYRVLYKINKINYDLAHYTLQQQADIDMNAYYYTD